MLSSFTLRSVRISCHFFSEPFESEFTRAKMTSFRNSSVWANTNVHKVSSSHMHCFQSITHTTVSHQSNLANRQTSLQSASSHNHMPLTHAHAFTTLSHHADALTLFGSDTGETGETAPARASVAFAVACTAAVLVCVCVCVTTALAGDDGAEVRRNDFADFAAQNEASYPHVFTTRAPVGLRNRRPSSSVASASD